jgi:flagellar motility protein MotE (MotC chaperone)
MRPYRALAALLPVYLFLAPAALGAPPAAEPRSAPATARSGKSPDLAEREKALKAEEERLLALRKEVEAKIAKYEKLLGQAEEKEKLRQAGEEAKADQLVKLFEGMPPEEAATRLAALDDDTAVAILARMKSRKASAALSSMDPKRVARIVQKMASGVKNFPPE